MEGNTVGENSAELRFSVGKIEYKQGQEVWMPVGEWSDGVSDAWLGRSALC